MRSPQALSVDDFLTRMSRLAAGSHNAVRTSTSPRLVMWPSMSMLPDWCTLGESPKYRPRLYEPKRIVDAGTERQRGNRPDTGRADRITFDNRDQQIVQRSVALPDSVSDLQHGGDERHRGRILVFDQLAHALLEAASAYFAHSEPKSAQLAVDVVLDIDKLTLHQATVGERDAEPLALGGLYQPSRIIYAMPLGSSVLCSCALIAESMGAASTTIIGRPRVVSLV
jgi:hypothetical protein